MHAAQMLGVELNRRQRVLDVVRHLARHLGPGLQPIGAFELGTLALQVVGHAVEVLDQAAAARRLEVDQHARVEVARAIRRVARVSRLTGSEMRSATE